MQKNLTRSSSGILRIERLVQHPLVEFQPAQFAIDEMSRAGDNWIGCAHDRQQSSRRPDLWKAAKAPRSWVKPHSRPGSSTPRFLQENLSMKVVIFLAGLALFLTTLGCEEEHEHHHHNQGYGGSYEGAPAYPYGHGDYHTYPGYGDRD